MDPAAKPLNYPLSAASASTMPMPIQTSFEMVGRAPVDQLRSVAGRGSATLPLTIRSPIDGLHRLLAPGTRPLANDSFRYEPIERFGEGLTTRRPWNTSALAGVELLNGRAAMVGFAAAVVGELITGHGPAGQLLALLRWYLG